MYKPFTYVDIKAGNHKEWRWNLNVSSQFWLNMSNKKYPFLGVLVPDKEKHSRPGHAPSSFPLVTVRACGEVCQCMWAEWLPCARERSEMPSVVRESFSLQPTPGRLLADHCPVVFIITAALLPFFQCSFITFLNLWLILLWLYFRSTACWCYYGKGTLMPWKTCFWLTV